VPVSSQESEWFGICVLILACFYNFLIGRLINFFGVLMPLSANISAISWQPVLVVEEA